MWRQRMAGFIFCISFVSLFLSMSLCVLWLGPAWQWSGWFVSCFRVNCLPSFVVWWPLAARPASGRAGFDSETLGFNFETLGFNFEMLGFKFEMLGFKFEMLGFKFEMLGFNFEMLGFEFEMLGFKFEMLGFNPRISNRPFCKTSERILLSEWPRKF